MNDLSVVGANPLAVVGSPNIAPGIYDGLPFDEYLKIPAVSVSGLKIIADCPAKFGVEREQSAAMRIGSLTHCAILEPEALERRYAATDLDRRGTKAWDEAERAAGGRELVKRAEWDAALGMRDAVHRHPVARTLLSGAVTERTLVWQDEETGIMCRGRLDAMSPIGCPVDVKTAADGSPSSFARQAARLRYHWQADYYLCGCMQLGLPADAFPFIVVEPDLPYIVSVYELSENDLLAGRQQYRSAMLRFAKLVVRPVREWPGYVENAITMINLPGWALENYS